MRREDDVKTTVQQQFGRHAEAYVTSMTHAKGEDLPLLVEWLKPNGDWVVLDVATGGGHVAKTLAPHCRFVVATDLTVPMLEAAARAHREAGLANIVHVQADAEQLPFLSESFDAVCCRIAAHHFPDPAAFVREACRVLRPRGLFLLIDNVAPEEPELAAIVNRVETLRDISHVRCLSVAEWRGLFQENGLRELQDRLRRKRFPFPQWVARTASSKEQEEAVERCLLDAPQAMKAYWNLDVQDGRVQSHQIDEWMVLCKKGGE
ncbi:class I SAM-dependent methyltransferase [Brevibacillus thermoruber]|jgi:ubiquinone/menaquinone biosynthesis C-methylase UbiE|uniref:class I SAM-dependent methyltransferase n=1 Tax=Brevibacillus thermoruber TaxID=33942 RepID=UPI0003FC995B|nr:class I SAM-dependent methyltransferase [Brevibacillus thermoruber]